MVSIKEGGVCPYCKDNDVEYGSFEIDGEEAYYEMVCNNCGKESKEWYILKYDETIGDENDE